MASQRDTLSDVLTEASKQVSAWPEWKRSDDVERRRREFEQRLVNMLKESHSHATEVQKQKKEQ